MPIKSISLVIVCLLGLSMGIDVDAQVNPVAKKSAAKKAAAKMDKPLNDPKITYQVTDKEGRIYSTATNPEEINDYVDLKKLGWRCVQRTMEQMREAALDTRVKSKSAELRAKYGVSLDLAGSLDEKEYVTRVGKSFLKYSKVSTLLSLKVNGSKNPKLSKLIFTSKNDPFVKTQTLACESQDVTPDRVLAALTQLEKELETRVNLINGFSVNPGANSPKEYEGEKNNLVEPPAHSFPAPNSGDSKARAI